MLDSSTSSPDENWSLDNWLMWLESLHSSEIDLGLRRVKIVADRLGVLQLSAKIVTVAGTNGKGSFVQSLSQLILDSNADIGLGLKVGTYTSPHIERYNERIAVNGAPVSDPLICRAFRDINAAREDISLTYFEFATLAALVIFKCAELDVVILEVGLGGRLDAVNIVDPDIAVITSIGLDHQEWLGDSRESIGREKAGILRRHIPFICVDAQPPQSVLDAASLNQNESFFWGTEIIESPEHRASSKSFHFKKQRVDLVLSDAQLPLPSLVAATQAALLLNKDINLLAAGKLLSDLSLAGRFERLSLEQYSYILDVAHNPQAATHLASKLESAGLRDTTCVIAVMRDKDISGIVEALSGRVKNWVCTEIPDFSRSLSSSDLSREVSGVIGDVSKVKSAASPIQAFELAKKMVDLNGAPQAPIIILGSFYLVSEFKTRYLPKMSGL